jgi:hypothetical protein
VRVGEILFIGFNGCDGDGRVSAWVVADPPLARVVEERRLALEQAPEASERRGGNLTQVLEFATLGQHVA